jgi:hypothetical protein
MFQKASSVFHVELNRTPLEERDSVVEEFSLATAGLESSPIAHYINASIRMQYVDTCIMLQDLSRATEIVNSQVAFGNFATGLTLAT